MSRRSGLTFEEHEIFAADENSSDGMLVLRCPPCSARWSTTRPAEALAPLGRNLLAVYETDPELDRLIEDGLFDVGDHSGGARLCQRLDQARSDSAGTAGNHRDRPLEVLHGTDVTPHGAGRVPAVVNSQVRGSALHRQFESKGRAGAWNM